MMRCGPLCCLMLGLCLNGWSADRGAAAAEKQAPAHHGPATTPSTHGGCHTPVALTEAAERQPGGALYEGPIAQHHGKHAMSMPQMQGTHMDHRPKRAGAFFMAPNKLHHLEAVYSDDCGFRLFFYNAFTRPIRADRFQGLIKIIPRDPSEPELMRFLSPAQGGAVLQTPVTEKVSRPFDIELYVKFPDAEAPQLFNIKVAAPGPGLRGVRDD